MNQDCIFCMILEGTVPSSMIYKDDLCTAFLDIQPVNAGHVLIIPNKHVESMVDLDDETTGRNWLNGIADEIKKHLTFI